MAELILRLTLINYILTLNYDICTKRVIAERERVAGPWVYLNLDHYLCFRCEVEPLFYGQLVYINYLTEKDAAQKEE